MIQWPYDQLSSIAIQQTTSLKDMRYQSLSSRQLVSHLEILLRIQSVRTQQAQLGLDSVLDLAHQVQKLHVCISSSDLQVP